MHDELNEYQRGMKNTFQLMYELLNEVEYVLRDDDGKLGETTRAVLGCFQLAFRGREELIEEAWAQELRARRTQEKV